MAVMWVMLNLCVVHFKIFPVSALANSLLQWSVWHVLMFSFENVSLIPRLTNLICFVTFVTYPTASLHEAQVQHLSLLVPARLVRLKEWLTQSYPSASCFKFLYIDENIFQFLRWQQPLLSAYVPEFWGFFTFTLDLCSLFRKESWISGKGQKVFQSLASPVKKIWTVENYS